jgi:hypothetical protein
MALRKPRREATPSAVVVAEMKERSMFNFLPGDANVSRIM